MLALQPSVLWAELPMWRPWPRRPRPALPVWVSRMCSVSSMQEVGWQSSHPLGGHHEAERPQSTERCEDTWGVVVNTAPCAVLGT